MLHLVFMDATRQKAGNFSYTNLPDSGHHCLPTNKGSPPIILRRCWEWKLEQPLWTKSSAINQLHDHRCVIHLGILTGIAPFSLDSIWETDGQTDKGSEVFLGTWCCEA